MRLWVQTRREDELAFQQSIIGRSVGFGGANQQADVQLVQKLLNAVPSAKGGPMPALDVDGMCGPVTCGAIKRFQSQNTGTGDGRIDPGQKTEQALLALLKALGVLAGLLAGGAATPGGGVSVPGPVQPPTPVGTAQTPAAGNGSQPSGGAQSPIRRRFMEICKTLLPAHGSLTAGSPAGPKGSACGEFPGRVFGRVPVIPPGQPGAFKVNLSGVGNCYLTTPMTAWEKFSQTVDAQYGASTWVPFTSNRPLPGDIYLLSKFDRPAEFQHVGVIVSADGSDWMTADAGQGNGWQSGFVKRRFQPSGQIDGEFGNTARLKGWVDLDALYAVAVAAFPKNL
jgi:peptidoglycan hydrolase-like protein with peptidoglycan-binding domain